jgi:hypothetical protein
MSRRFLGCGFAVAIAFSSVALAQNPTTQPPPAQQPSPTTRPSEPGKTTQAEPAKTTEAMGPAVTVEGCVVREVDAPGRTPPPEMQSRANTDDDYILTETKVVKGSAPTAAMSKPSDSPTGTAGMAAPALMYEIDELDKGQLKNHIGKRVQIEGTLEHPERAGNPVTYANDLVELKGTSIRAVEGTCAAKK